MKVVIFGGTSILAKYLVRQLVKNKIEVLTIGRQDCDLNIINDNFDIAELPKNIDVAINTIVYSDDGSNEEISLAIDTNVIGTTKLFEACSKAAIPHFIHISSIFSELPENSVYYSAYAMTKRMSEQALDLMTKESKQTKLTVLRPSQFVSLNDDYKKHQPFLYDLLQKIATHKDIVFWGTKTPDRNYLFVEEFAYIVQLVITKKIFGSYQCLFPKNTNYLEIVKSSILDTNSQSKVSFDLTKNNLPDNTFSFDNELFSKISFTPQHYINEYAQHIVNIQRIS